PRRADGLILQEGTFRLETPEGLETPKGTIELPGGELLNIDVRRVRTAEVPPGFSFSAARSGWEYHYAGHLTQNWPRHASSSGVVNQRQALVGSVIILRAPLPADRADGYKHLGPVGSVYPFIAVKE